MALSLKAFSFAAHLSHYILHLSDSQDMNTLSILPFLYIGPGMGVGSIIILAGLLLALGFVLYSFVYLPLRKVFRRK